MTRSSSINRTEGSDSVGNTASIKRGCATGTTRARQTAQWATNSEAEVRSPACLEASGGLCILRSDEVGAGGGAACREGGNDRAGAAACGATNVAGHILDLQ